MCQGEVSVRALFSWLWRGAWCASSEEVSVSPLRLLPVLWRSAQHTHGRWKRGAGRVPPRMLWERVAGPSHGVGIWMAVRPLRVSLCSSGYEPDPAFHPSFSPSLPLSNSDSNTLYWHGEGTHCQSIDLVN